MSAFAYEPGTVAVATVRGVPNIDVMFVVVGSATPSQRWVSPVPIGGGWIHRLDQVEDVTPVVRLDLDLAAHIGVDFLVADLRTSGFYDIANQIEAQTGEVPA